MKKNLYRKSSLEKISSPEQLDQMLTLTSPAVWLAILGGILCICAVLVWACTFWINNTETVGGIYVKDTELQEKLGLESANTVRCYVSFEKAGEIQPGMDAYVYLADSETEDYGSIAGTVVKVDAEITDQNALEEMLGTSSVANYLTQGNPVVCVYVALDYAPEEKCGYRWSKSAGSGYALRDNNLVYTDIEISSKHPITMMIPEIQPLLDQIVGEKG